MNHLAQAPLLYFHMSKSWDFWQKIIFIPDFAPPDITSTIRSFISQCHMAWQWIGFTWKICPTLL